MAIEKGAKLREDLRTLVVESPMDEVQYAADKILPPISVVQPSGSIPVLPTSAGMKDLDLRKGERGTYKRSEWVWGKTTFTTAEYGYEELINNVQALEHADIFDEEVVAARIGYSQLRLAREKRVADAIFNTSTFTGTPNVQAAGTAWTTPASADPWKNFDDAYTKIKAKAGLPKSALTAIIPELAFRRAMKVDAVIENVKYTQNIEVLPMNQKAQFFADYLGVKNIHVVDSIIDSTPQGIEAADFGAIWDETMAMLAYLSPESPSWKTPGLGRQPRWSKFAKDVKVDSYDENNTDSRVVRTREFSGEAVNTTFGVLLTGVTA